MDTINRTSDGLREIALFAGAGGGILGGQLLGWRTICAVEFDPHARAVLCARQNDGCLEPFPIWDDVCTFDGRPWRGRCDVVSGGFPCQDISCAGKGVGITGERSGLWGEMARIVGEVRPSFVWVENSPMLVSRGLGLVLSDLASLGYDARWGVVSAGDAGAPHQRKRLWIMAYPVQSSNALQRAEWRPRNISCGSCEVRAAVANEHFGSASNSDAKKFAHHWTSDPADEPKSGVGRVAHGVAYGVDRLERIGNGQCPQAMALAWNLLSALP